jgi:uncharacterized membrane protein
MRVCRAGLRALSYIVVLFILMSAVSTPASAGLIIQLYLTQYFDYNDPLNVPGLPTATWISQPFDVATGSNIIFPNSPNSTTQMPAELVITSVPIIHWDNGGVLEFVPATFTYKGIPYEPVLNDSVPFCFQPCTQIVPDYFPLPSGAYASTGHFDQVSGVLVTLPEPTSLSLMAIGAGVLVYRRRKSLT